MDNLGLSLLAGVDIPVPECKLIIHQPMIEEIGLIGEQSYFEGAQLLCCSKKNINIKDESLLENTSNFEIFMTAISDQRMKEKKKQTLQALSLLCPNYNITFTPSSMIMQKDSEISMIDENNFQDFQNVIKSVICMGNEKMQGAAGFNPQGKRAEEIADKLMKARQKVAEEKGIENSSILGQQVSSLAIALHLPISQVLSMTLYQLLDQMERYQLYMSWDIDIRSRLAGAKAEKELEDWMKPIH